MSGVTKKGLTHCRCPCSEDQGEWIVSLRWTGKRIGNWGLTSVCRIRAGLVVFVHRTCQSKLWNAARISVLLELESSSLPNTEYTVKSRR